jgi:hypothetical protein
MKGYFLLKYEVQDSDVRPGKLVILSESGNFLQSILDGQCSCYTQVFRSGPIYRRVQSDKLKELGYMVLYLLHDDKVFKMGCFTLSEARR